MLKYSKKTVVNMSKSNQLTQVAKRELWPSALIICTLCAGLSNAAAAPIYIADNTGSGNKPSLQLKKHTAVSELFCTAELLETHSPHKSPLHEHNCLISISAAEKLRAQSGFQMVDVRAEPEFENYHIADSINIPLYLVKTKSFLKKQHIVLVNDGRSTTELENACAELKQDGFEKVSVLDGGLFSWRANKGSLVGDEIEQSKINRMQVSELAVEHNHNDWSVIDISTPGKYKDIRTWLPANVTAIPLTAKSSTRLQIAAKITSLRKTQPQKMILLVADDDEAYRQIDAGLKKSEISGLLRLEGGLNAYRNYVVQQTALWKQKNQQRKYEACHG
jgi:rhodanese-related sulfurtransferase